MMRVVHCRSKLPPSLSQCLQLEDLWVAGPSLKEVTQAASSLTRLTSLTVFNEPSQEPQVGLRLAHQGQVQE